MDSENDLPRLTHDLYTVACICPMGVELAALAAMFDEPHQTLPPSGRAKNSYRLGRIGGHNVVIAVMPEIGNNQAASVAIQLLNDFRSIRFGLLVGIGGGIPVEDEHDIRLGDVVVSKPTETFGGVVQFDRGKAHTDGRFERTGTLNKPPPVLMANVQSLQAQHLMTGSQISRYLVEMLERYPAMQESQYVYQGAENDLLFETDYEHQGKNTCKSCDRSKLVDRLSRPTTSPRIHYGTIGSANQVIKDAVTKERLQEDLGIICVEMEAAGLMDEFPCLVIRGICDYADSHKNKRWQPYAAATAAAYAKELLVAIPAQEVKKAKGALEALQISKEQDRLLEKLPYAPEAAHTSPLWEHQDRCLAGTRVQLLQRVSQWSKDEDGASLFWFGGMAGTGKSAVTRTVADQLAKEGRLAASFFFSRSYAELSHGGRFVASIAMQLATKSPTLKRYICDSISSYTDITGQGLRYQWTHLILSPLSKLESQGALSWPLVLVVDALDECGNEEHVRLILQLLAETEHLKGHHLRAFLTSRPESIILHGLSKFSRIEPDEPMFHGISTQGMDQDIRIFIERKLGTVASELRLINGWPGCEKIDRLVKKASGIFEWAATACRFIHKGKSLATERLSRILEGRDSTIAPEKRLDQIYMTVLESSIDEGYSDEERELQQARLRFLLAILASLYTPISVTSLCELFTVPHEQLHGLLSGLRSVLSVPDDPSQPIQLHHPSFRDFIQDSTRCSNEKFWMAPNDAHAELAQACIVRMQDKLKRNICGLRHPSTELNSIDPAVIHKAIPADLNYACRYWIQHVDESDVYIEDFKVYQFLQVNFLYWVEALSLMGKLAEGVRAIELLETTFRGWFILGRHSQGTDNVYRKQYLLHDARRFLIYSASLIENAPLQTYCSALVFSPTRCRIHKAFSTFQPSWISALKNPIQNWSPLLQSLEGHSDHITSLVLSHDGTLIASASLDGTIRLWSSTTGRLLHIYEERSGSIHTFRFLPDDNLLVSITNGGAINLWNTSGSLFRSFEEPSSDLQTIAVSRDGKTIAVAFPGKILKLLDTFSGETVRILMGHFRTVGCGEFSNSSGLLVAVTDTHNITIWNTSAGVVLKTLEANPDPITTVAFSPDGNLVISGSAGGYVRLWGITDGKVHFWETTADVRSCDLGKHPNSVSSALFSQDGKLIASTCEKYVNLWNPDTGTLQHVCSFSGRSINVVAFSNDGTLLAAGLKYTEQDVAVLDTTTGQVVQSLEGHSCGVSAVAFSRHDEMVISAGQDSTIKVWDAKVRINMGLSSLGSVDRQKVVISNDGSLVALGNSYGITVWKPETDKSYKFSSSSAESITISPGGEWLASSHGSYIRVRETATMTLVWDRDLEFIPTLAFSPDGKLLGAACYTQSWFWDTATGSLLHMVHGVFTRLIISPDGKTVAALALPPKIELIDITTETVVHGLGGYDLYWSVTFSPDGKLLASIGNETAKLWDTKTGSMLQELHVVSHQALAVAFSMDNRLVAASFSDKTVRLWETGSGSPRRTIQLDVPIRNMSFSQNGPFLETERGLLELPNFPASHEAYNGNLDPDIFVGHRWVTFRGHNILWTPPEYRSSTTEIRGSTLVIGQKSGPAIMMKLELSILRRQYQFIDDEANTI